MPQRLRGPRAKPRSWRLLTALTAAALAASVTVTVVDGSPPRLPGVALGSPVLLHAERTLALFAIVVAAVSVMRQAARGRLPIELSTSGLRYEAEASEDVAAAVVSVQHELDHLEESIHVRNERMDAVSRRR